MIILMKFKNCFMNHHALKKIEARVEKNILFLGNTVIYVHRMKYYMFIYEKSTCLSMKKVRGYQKMVRYLSSRVLF